MSSPQYIKATMALEVLNQAPSLIRKALLEDRTFREKYGLTANVVIRIDDSNIFFQRSDFFDAVRQILSGTAELAVVDKDNNEWKLCDKKNNGELPSLLLSSGEKRVVLSGFAVLSPDTAIRLRALNKSASDVNLPAAAKADWQAILSTRPLQDEEVDEFHYHFRDTPVHVAQSIRDEILGGTSSISSLVPPSRRYFDRLVGVYDGSASVNDYAAGAAKQLFADLSAWRPFEGFLFSLFLSSHAALTKEINVTRLESEDLVRAFEFLIAMKINVSWIL